MGCSLASALASAERVTREGEETKRTRSFLKSHDLSISKFTAIVNQTHGSLRSTDFARTFIGFRDLSSIDFDGNGVRTSEASEEG